jgi:hypothetical protein
VAVGAGVEGAGAERLGGVGEQQLQRPGGEGLALGRAQLLLVGAAQLRPRDRPVEVRDGATPALFVDQLDQAELLQLADVVTDVADRLAQLVGDLLRAGAPFGQDRERLGSDGVGGDPDQRLLLRKCDPRLISDFFLDPASLVRNP